MTVAEAAAELPTGIIGDIKSFFMLHMQHERGTGVDAARSADPFMTES